MYSFEVFVLIASAVFYYRVGKAEYGSGWISASLSVLVWCVTALVLRGGLIAIALAQLLVLAGMTVYNYKTGREKFF